jgi:hypothetical protein
MNLVHPFGFHKGEAAGGGDATVFPAKGDYAVFDGANDYVLVPNDSTLLPNEISVSFWAKLDNLTSATLKVPIGIWDYSGNKRSWSMYFNAGSAALNWVVSSDGTFVTSTYRRTLSSALSNGVWYHVVGTFSGGTSNLYINGSLDNAIQQGTATSIYTSNTTNMLIGAHYDVATPVRFVDGSIRDVRIYDKALTASEVTYLYTA